MISFLRGDGTVAERLKNLSVYLVSGRGKKYTPQMSMACSM